MRTPADCSPPILFFFIFVLILFAIYLQNFTILSWDNEIKKVNGEET